MATKSSEYFHNFPNLNRYLNTQFSIFFPPPKTYSEAVQTTPQPDTSTSRSLRSQSHSTNVSKMNRSRCFRCGGANHVARDCREPVRCFHCRKFGYKRFSCPSLFSPGSSSSPRESLYNKKNSSTFKRTLNDYGGLDFYHDKAFQLCLVLAKMRRIALDKTPIDLELVDEAAIVFDLIYSHLFPDKFLSSSSNLIPSLAFVPTIIPSKQRGQVDERLKPNALDCDPYVLELDRNIFSFKPDVTTLDPEILEPPVMISGLCTLTGKDNTSPVDDLNQLSTCLLTSRSTPDFSMSTNNNEDDPLFSTDFIDTYKKLDTLDGVHHVVCGNESSVRNESLDCLTIIPVDRADSSLKPIGSQATSHLHSPHYAKSAKSTSGRLALYNSFSALTFLEDSVESDNLVPYVYKHDLTRGSNISEEDTGCTQSPLMVEEDYDSQDNPLCSQDLLHKEEYTNGLGSSTNFKRSLNTVPVNTDCNSSGLVVPHFSSVDLPFNFSGTLYNPRNLLQSSSIYN